MDGLSDRSRNSSRWRHFPRRSVRISAVISLSTRCGAWFTPLVVMSETDARRRVDELEEELDRRQQEWAAQKAALIARLAAAHEVLAAADERDDLADARDVAARKRGSDRDLADFRITGGAAEYADDRSERREAAAGREQAKDDREAAQEDRIALTKDLTATGPDDQTDRVRSHLGDQDINSRVE
jgi:hypothetical protein